MTHTEDRPTDHTEIDAQSMLSEGGPVNPGDESKEGNHPGTPGENMPDGAEHEQPPVADPAPEPEEQQA